MLNKDAWKTQTSFAYSPTSGTVLPFASFTEKIKTAWQQVNWPIFKTILKADLAVMIVFGLVMYDPIRERASTSGILGCIAVEFIHPCKSLGFLTEDAIFGALMCTVSAAYSILGTYCASLVRNPDDLTQAQPAVCGVLMTFLAVGSFVLNYVRVRVDQANVGGMLSASIMCLSLIGAVLEPTWSPMTAVVYMAPPLVGFLAIFLVFLLLAPENSTTFFVQDMVKTLETFSDITRQQAQGFFQSNYNGVIKETQAQVPDTPAEIHNKIDVLLLSLIQRKRNVCREVTYNAVSPTDAKELTKLLKRLRVPLHGVSIGRVMATNLRKLDLIQRTMMTNSHGPTAPMRGTPLRLSSYSGRPDMAIQSPSPRPPAFFLNSNASYVRTVGNGDDEDPVPASWYGDDDLLQEQQIQLEHQFQQQQQQHCLQQIHRLANNDSPNPSHHRTGPSPSILMREPTPSILSASPSPPVDSSSSTPRQSVTLEENTALASIQHDEYISVLQQTRPIYINLSSACSVAIDETIKRLRRMAGIDPRYQNKPWIYRFVRQHVLHDPPNSAIMYDPTVDPSLDLLRAIQQFDAKRLVALSRLYNHQKYPRRALLLILLFQFNLRTYAEIVYTLSSLVYDMDQVRRHRRFWFPNISLQKFFAMKREPAFDLDAPSAITQHQTSSNLQRTLTHHTVLMQSFVNDSLAYQQKNRHRQTLQRHNEEPADQEIHDDIDGIQDADAPPSRSSRSSSSDDDNDPSSSSLDTFSFQGIDVEKIMEDDAAMDSTVKALSRSLTYPVRGQVLTEEDARHTWFRLGLKKTNSSMRRTTSNSASGSAAAPRRRSSVSQKKATSPPLLVKLHRWRRLFSRRTGNVLPSYFLDPYTYHDPDAGYPTTRAQRFFYRCWEFGHNYIYTSDAAFALRAAILVVCLSLPGFLEQSIGWYSRTKGQWAPVVALIWMGPSVGSCFFGTMVRTLGTFVGAVCGLMIWEITQGNIWGILVVNFIFNIPMYMIYTLSTFWRATGLFSLITTSLILGYGYIYKVTGVPISVYEVTYERTVAVLVGVFAAMLISIFPYAHTSRVEVRHHISKILGDIGALYASFLGLLLKGSRYEYQLRKTNQKLFKTFANSIRQHIKITRTLMEQSRFEPTLRGPFPEKQYLRLLQVLDNILNILLQMELAMEKTDTRYRLNIVNVTWTERKDMIASILTALQVASNALVNKTPLPPYIIRPTKARRILTDKVRHLPPFSIERLGEPEYTYYSTYLMNSEQLAVEVEILVTTVRDLVGPDSVSVYLDYVH
ncbi:hypothetical protein DM01DRAFT_1383643 [Hesseltinella vesiculosa]|uniref:Uncharacterized protein n=1 Tax=Hesseltinella vesiculosa TaxID=101127 RepID=A0A1X2GH59_9FUNG|nr:hypothetical protein DM01DRAFT_1383643 [Hesseltinella vesiculosa]